MIDLAVFTRQNSTQQVITKLWTLLGNVTAIYGSQLCYCSNYVILILLHMNSTLTAKFDVLTQVLLKIHAFWDLMSCCWALYEACLESKVTSHVGRRGNFLCLLWQHCHRPWSFTCEPCSLDSGRTGFVWVRHVWNGSTNPKSCQMRGALRPTISQCKWWTSNGNSQTNCGCLW